MRRAARGPWRAFLAPAVALVLVAGSARGAGKGRFYAAYSTDSRETLTEKETFKPDTPKVYVVYTLAEVPQGAKLKAVWIAEKLEGVQENSKMNEAQTTAGSNINGLFSYSKPTHGWPAGTYRVELYIDDKLDKTVKFKVGKP